MTFQLWETESANLVGSYPTEEAALAVVRSAIEKHGLEALDTIVLLREGARGRLTTVAEGPALVELALGRTSPAA
jgi:hypothetical protein